MDLILLLLIAVVSVATRNTRTYALPPHIIYILGDDLGWNDLSYHGSNQIPTPNIDSLAYNGVILNRYYVQPMCTPSRASLMTGKYSIHTGQHTATKGFHKSGLPLSNKIMPEYFKDLGYSTHIVGKWHLGFYKKELTPLERGFDTHFGYWTGFISYYDHIHEVSSARGLNKTDYCGYDLRRGYQTAWDAKGQYATDLFTKEAVNLIDQHDDGKPMFLYLAHLAVHSGNEGNLLEVSREESLKCSYISSPSRRTYAAMVSKLDDSVGAVVGALGRKNMLKNSVIVFASDNGPPNIGPYKNWGSCYPFRGQKGSLWEGGVRAPALIWSPLINKPSRVNNDLMHISDWLPTLLSAAGYHHELTDIDGLDQWQAISNGYPSPRENIVLDIYDAEKLNGFITGPFKYIKGARGIQDEEVDDFLNFDTIFSKNAPIYNIEKIMSGPVWTQLKSFMSVETIVERVLQLRSASTVTCDHNMYSNKTISCQTTSCLFNVIEDPCEQVNIADSFPFLTRHIEGVLSNMRLNKYPEDSLDRDPLANPDLFNGTWASWTS